MQKGKTQKLSDRQLKAIILTEGGKHIGLGHIYRCEAIIAALKKLGVDCSLIINGDSSVKEISINTTFQIKNWLKDFRAVYKLPAEILVIDSYLATRDILETLSSGFNLAVFIDDFNRLDYPRGLVINSSIGAHLLNYNKRNGINYILGPKYHSLRIEFWNSKKKDVKWDVKNILVTLGGSDMKNLTPSILKILSQKTEIKKNVIIGKGFSNINEIEESADITCDLIRFPDAQQMNSLMIDADIAISAAGQTLYELASLGVPTIAIAVADNQDLNVRGWSDNDFMEFAGWWDDPDLTTNILKKIDYLKDYETRIKQSKAGQARIDSSGALQLGKEILNKIK